MLPKICSRRRELSSLKKEQITVLSSNVCHIKGKCASLYHFLANSPVNSFTTLLALVHTPESDEAMRKPFLGGA